MLFRSRYPDEFNKALFVCARLFGENHPDTATSYNNIAGVYEAMGEYEKAVVGYQKALSVFRNVLGDDHPDTAMMHNNIAYAYDHMGEYMKASKGYHAALCILERTMGKRHPYSRMVRDNIRGLPREYRSGDGGRFGVYGNKVGRILDGFMERIHTYTERKE